ncbi:NAD-dependent epimerase/dehydratase family protein [Pedobacter sp. HDW13]|uniref:NAD-dependent epimerase/dehydratase family protein n=1 Tax=Pedobacter sp. HDW13 TaxID=2714940 RepID=UPI00140DCE41|nr:NAD-dependent epimerase/dehydratase family protein [Pedobacter sp. HDW13]QIL39211.1 NAD-dependent epimerase/dehydratase family protein [Pedobacter sp. HDW13]
MKTVAIIGGNGFIGKNFASYFANKGYQVSVIDRSISGAAAENKYIRYFSVDIHHTPELIGICESADAVIWLVHASVPSTKDESLVDDFMLNVSPIVKFLEKAEQISSLAKFVYLSSGGTVYGNVSTHQPIKEIQELNPISNYGLSKVVAEDYVRYITQDKSFESVILRPSNVYGPYQNLVKPQGIVGFAFNSIKNNTILDLYDEGRVIRDFIFVGDLVEAVESSILMEKNSGKTTIYNVGSGDGHSIREIIAKIEEITGSQLQLNHKSSRNFDCAYNVLDTTKLLDHTGWHKKTPMEEGLQKVWNWIENEN